MYWLLGFSAFAVFLGIAAIGFIVLIVSFVFGEIFEHGGDFFGGHDADFHADTGISVLSSRVVSVFITAF